MTVKELIEELSQVEDQDIRVITKGYEGGFNDVIFKLPAVYDVALDVNDEWYYGAHEIVSESTQYIDKEIVKAIII